MRLLPRESGYSHQTHMRAYPKSSSKQEGVGQDHVRRYFADSARRNVHESAFIKDRGISEDTEEKVYTL